jgi:hypothetical protein
MSKDATACTSALAQLDELIKDKDKVLLLAERMDQVRITSTNNSITLKPNYFKRFILLQVLLIIIGL